MRVLSRLAAAHGARLIVRERVEYIGGPRAGTDGLLDGVPEELVEPDGRYVRSVRCALDGAMRYVWRDARPRRKSDRAVAGRTRGARVSR